MNLLSLILFLCVFIILIVPIGKYLSKLIVHEKTLGERLFTTIEVPIFKLLKCKNENMGLKSYIVSFLSVNFIMFIFTYIILYIQGDSLSLAFNTAISFVTNTNLQHYSGEVLNSTISRLILINLMFTSAATGMVICMAVIREIMGIKIGNFYEDLVKVVIRLLLPISLVVAILLVICGLPQTFDNQVIVRTLEGKYQAIALGPVAAWEAIKHLGNNGGGLFTANSAHPFENISIWSNYIEMLSMMVFPGATIIAFGIVAKNKKQGWYIFISVFILFILSFFMIYHFEKQGTPILKELGISGINMEGKEVRFGLFASTLFTNITTSFTTGSINNMHDSLTPLAGMFALGNMMLNCIFGGKGVGFINILMYMILGVFLCGLMVGRTPEFFGKKVEAKEIQIITFLILLHPLIILLPSAISLIVRYGYEGISTAGFHGITQVLYEYVSSAANNGSGFEGLKDNTSFWNIMTGIVILLGRYVNMVLMTIVGYSFYKKKVVPTTETSFRTDNIIFSLVLIFIILTIGALTFLPALALGPIAEHLSIWR